LDDLDAAISIAAARDLDGAYNSGRTITVDAGAVQLNDSQNTAISNALYVNSTGIVGGASDRTVVSIANNAAHTSTGEIRALDVDMGGDYSAGNGDATGINVDLYAVTNAGTKTGVNVRMRTQTEMGIRTNGSLQIDGSATLGSSAGDVVTINAGPVNLPNATSASDAVVFGSTDSANLYRSAANTLKTDGNLVVDGSITVGGTLSGMLKEVTDDADGKTLAVSESGTLQTNAGASSVGIWNLPEASTAIGAVFTFVVASMQNLNINPDDADQILGLTDAVGDSIQSSTIGETITLVAIDSSNWVVMSSYGTWTDAN
jgi:hypothetical protein